MALNEKEASGCLAVVGAVSATLGYFATGNPRCLYVAVMFPVSIGAILATLHIASRVMEWWRPSLPVCRRGRCTSRRYRIKFHGEDPLYEGTVYQCACQDKYVYQDMRFMQLRADGTLLPYLRHTRYGRWTADDIRESSRACPGAATLESRDGGGADPER